MERGPESIAQGARICKFCPHRMMGALEVRIDQNRFMPWAKGLQTAGLIRLAQGRRRASFFRVKARLRYDGPQATSAEGSFALRASPKIHGIVPAEKPIDLQRAGFRIYGLTGGAGSGKTEAARVIEECGIPVISADAIGHELIAPGGAAEEAVRAAFGESVLSGGVIDRSKLGARVFADVEARRRLNKIVHPLIARTIEERCRRLAKQGCRMAVIDAALLCEDGRKGTFLDGLIMVHCDRETRIQRLMRQRSWTREQAVERADAQTPPERKLPWADWVIDNTGTLDALRADARALAEEISGHAS